MMIKPYAFNRNFKPLGQTSRNWSGICATSNGNIYACESSTTGDIYKQTNGTGTFTALSQVDKYWGYIAASPSGNVYALGINVGGGNDYLYKQTGETGDFSVTTFNSFRSSVTVSLNNNVYVAGISPERIYMQTNESGSFNDLGAGTVYPQYVNWLSIKCSHKGDIYAVQEHGTIYKRTNDTGNFVSHLVLATQCVVSSISNNLYILLHSDQKTIKRQINGSGIPTGFTVLTVYANDMCTDINGHMYATTNGDIYKLTVPSTTYL